MSHEQRSTTTAPSASVSARPPQNTPNPLFDQALERHLESLQPEDREAFEQCTAEDVIAAAEQLSSAYAAQSSARRCLARFADVVRPLEAYFDLVGGVIGLVPGAQLVGILWGALRFVVKAVNGVSDYFERIVGVLEEITGSLPFYQDYALEIYRGSARVQQALADVYNDILVVCSAVRRVFLKKGGAPRSGLSIFLKALNPWNKTIEEVTQGLQRRREVLEREVVHAGRMSDHADRVSRQRQAVEREWDDRRREFLALLPYEDCHSKHEDCLSALSPDNNAGNWLLNRKEFLNWAYKHPSGMLWVHGKPGVGKTVLASIVIEWARNTLISGKRPAVAFFYCQHDDPKKHDPKSLLATLLHQVLTQLPADPWDDLEFDGFSTTQSSEKLCSSLNSASVFLETVKPTFLVVDGLDECDTATRKRLLPLLESLGHSSRLLLISRKEGDIWNALKNTSQISISEKDVENDIQEYICRKIKLVDEEGSSNETLEVHDPALLEEVLRTLFEGADGMFLWVQLQIDHLQEQRTDHDVRTALKSLTRGLQPTFTRILKSIDRLPVPRRARAKRVLRWVVCAVFPLRLGDLSEAVAIRDMQDVWDESRCVNRPATLIEDCFSLVLCTDNDRVQLTHSSMKEFLLQNPALLDPSLADYHIYPLLDAHVSLVEDCLKYLQLKAEAAQREFEADDFRLLRLDPFVTYASEYWPQHLRASGPAGELLVFAFAEFLRLNSRSREFWSRLHNRKRDDIVHSTMSICHLAARLSLPHIVRSILANGLDDAGAQGSQGLTAMHWAAKFAEESTLRVLVESGADINAKNSDGQTPLHLAAGNWDGECIVEVLLDLGADVSVVDKYGKTPLHVAAENGYGQNSVLLLLLHGASIWKVCNHGQLPLHAAAANPYGCVSVQHLLSYGADVNSLNTQRRTPLHAAAGIWFRGIDSVRLLVENGADVNATDQGGFAPLHMAAQSKGGGECIRYLIEHGARADATSVNATTPLHLVAKSRLGHDAARCLLENGANIEAIDQYMQTPLHVAAEFQEDTNLIQVMLDHRANIHARDGEGLTPLLRTTQVRSRDKIASLLLERGSSIDDVDRERCTPLHLAARMSLHEDPRTVRVLLRYGAAVGARNDSGMTPLHCAAEYGDSGVIAKVLLEHGASVDDVDRKGRTPLHLAMKVGVARAFLRYGAQVDARDDSGMTPLHYAAAIRNSGVVEVLLEHGADINIVTSLGQTTLHLAVAGVSVLFWGHVVTMLLQRGADPYIVDTEGRTAFDCVSDPDELRRLVACSSSAAGANPN